MTNAVLTEEVPKFSKLRQLTICAQDIGNRGLKAIVQISNLEYIDLKNTGITNDGINLLQKKIGLYSQVIVDRNYKLDSLALLR